MVNSTKLATPTFTGGAPRGRSRSMPCSPKPRKRSRQRETCTRDAQSLGDALVLQALCGQRHDLRTLRQLDTTVGADAELTHGADFELTRPTG
jgi:hypothetical protein